MRIFYDGTIYDIQVSGGVNRYFVNIIRRLPGDWVPMVASLGPAPRQALQHPRLKTYGYHRWGRRPSCLFHRLAPYYFRSLARLTRPALLHPTYYSLLGDLQFRDYRCPVVVTVYDLIHEIFAAEFDPDGCQAAGKRRAIAAADRILCISANTEADLLNHYPEAAGKTTVTLLAPELDASQAGGDDPVPAAPYVLYVGSRWPYKNLGCLLQAVANLVPRYPELTLCLVGPPLTSAEQQVIANLNLTPHLVSYCYPSDRHLAKLYRCSLALAYPSLYEGFGLPPLEAMACGTAVIVADTASLPEVVGEAALRFDPWTPQASDDLTDGLRLLLESPAVRDRLVTAGHAHVQQFSWAKTAAQTCAVYQSLG